MGQIKSFFKRSPWGQALLLLLTWNLLIRLIAVLGYFILPQRFAPLDFIHPLFRQNYLIWSFANYDGEHYLSIARNNYGFRGGFPQYAFFPLLPTLISLTQIVFRDYLIAGLVVTQLSLWVALVYLRLWTEKLKLKNIQFLVLASTGAIFLASVYTEPLFLALASMTMYFAENRRWGRAVVTTALATATRVNGIFLVAFLFMKLSSAKLSNATKALYVGLSFTGLVTYMGFLWHKTGDPLGWYHSQGSWGKANPTSPITTLISYLRALTVDFHFDLVHLVVLFEVVITLLSLSLLYQVIRRRKLDPGYWVYLGGNLAMPILTGSLGSMPRFFLILFPLLTVLPDLPKSHQYRYTYTTLVIALVGVILFTRGYWYG